MAKTKHKRGESQQYRRTGAELAADRLQIATMMLEGHSRFTGARLTQSYIAKELGISPSTVSRDVAFLEAQWKEEAKATFDQMKAKQLAQIRHLRRLYYKGFHSSEEDRVKIQKKIDNLRTTGTDPITAAAENVPWKQAGDGDEPAKALPYEDLPELSVSWTIEGRDGDVRWLQGVERTLLAERRVMGFDDLGKPDTGNAQRIADAIRSLPQTLIDDLNKRYGHPDDQIFE